jgi:OOP family OmpA-OmpF porin
MNTYLKAITAVAFVVATAGIATADEGDKYAYILGSSLEPDTIFDQEDGTGIQVGIGREAGPMLNVEGYLRTTSADGTPSFKTNAIGADLQFVFFRDSIIEPYLFGGFGIQSTKLSGSSADNGAVTNAGVGFRANVFGNRRVALRAEYRYMNYEGEGVNLDDQLYSLGVQFGFGRKAPPPVVAAAPPPPAPAPPPRDSDGDGVVDGVDQCPGTVRGAAVDARGCELDDDKDGVVNRLDKCPNTRAGAQVDVNGCEIMAEITLPGVTFQSNSDRLVPGTESVLNDAATTLIRNPSITVEVAGHTDSDGAAEYNESLSARRAATVRDYLIARGVSESRMTARGYGESQPVDSNATPAGKAANRRVVLRITAR